MATSTIVLLSDSTNAWFVDTADRPSNMVTELYDRFKVTIKTSECSTLTGSYQALDVTKPGIGSDEIILYDGSVGSKGISDYDDPSVLAARVTAVSPDIVLIALGINGATGAGTADLISSVKGVAPFATIIVIAQNPTSTEGEDSTRRDTIQTDAASESVTFVDVWQDFVNYGDWENDLLTDSVHPNSDGQDLYVARVAPVLSNAIAITPQEVPVSVLDSAVLVLRAGMYSGSGNWLDESGNGYHAVPSGSPSFDGTKFTLNGSTQFFTVSDQDELDPASGDFTVVAVATPTASATDYRIVNKRAGGVDWWGLDYAGGSTRAQWAMSDSTSTRVGNSGSTTWPQDTLGVASGRHQTSSPWQRVGVNGTYVNFGGSLTDTSSTTDLLIGAWSVNTANRFVGDIYGVAVWQSYLSDAEVEAAGVALQLSYNVADAATLHGDGLKAWILENVSSGYTSTELVGMLNELNGTNGVEYAQARGTFLGVDPAG